MKQKNKKASKRKRKLLVGILVIAAVVLIGYFAVYRPLRAKAVDRIAEELLQTQISSGDTSVDAEEILDSMSEEDHEAVEEIITNHISPGTIAEVSSYLTSGDTAGLKEYAQNALTEEELAELEEIYGKYQEEINTYLNQ